MRGRRPGHASLIAAITVAASACGSGAVDSVSSTSATPPGLTTSAAPTAAPPASTTIAPPDDSVCPQPYQPQAYRFVAPSQTQVVSSGPIAALTWTEIPQLAVPFEEYPGTPPEPPAGVTVAGRPLGVVDLGPLGTYTGYVGTTAPQTVYLANPDRVMELASPQNYTIAFHFYATPDGAIYAQVDNNDRSGASFVRWRLDDPCAPPAPGPPYLEF